MRTSKPDTPQRAAEQATAARILLALTNHQIDAKLPIASWHLSAFATELSGNVTSLEYDHNNNLHRDDKISIANVRAWGRSLGVEPVYQKWETESSAGELFITIKENGITINIWARISIHEPIAGEISGR